MTQIARKEAFAAAYDSTTQPTVEALLSAMTQGPTTANWDILVSYSITAINGLLASAYSSSGSTMPQTLPPLTYPVTSPFPGQPSGTITWNITLGAPTISIDEGGQCVLSMGLSGSFTTQVQGQDPSAPIQIPSDTYTVTVEVPIGAVAGEGGAPPVSSGSVFTFSGAQQAKLFLQISTTTDAQWSIQPPPPGGVYQTVLPYLLDYFQSNVQDIDYALCGISGAPAPLQPGQNEIVITPLSFVVTTLTSDSGGVLCIYIQTQNTGNPPGDVANLVFAPGGTPMLPVPQGEQASIIFSRDLIGRVYIAGQLDASGFCSGQNMQSATGGMTVQACWTTNVTEPGTVYGNSDTGEVEVSQTVIDFSTNPFSFAFAGGNLTISLAATAKVQWRDCNFEARPVSYGPWHNTTVDVAVNQVTPLSSCISLTQTSLQVSISIASSNYSVTVPSDPFSMSSILVQTLQSAVEGIVPSISLSLNGLYYFYTTNLLFNTSAQVLQIDTSTGLNIPCDTVVFGSVVASA